MVGEEKSWWWFWWRSSHGCGGSHGGVVVVGETQANLTYLVTDRQKADGRQTLWVISTDKAQWYTATATYHTTPAA